MASGEWNPLILRVRDLVQSRNREDQLVAVRLAQTATLKAPDEPGLQHALARAALTAEDYPTAEAAYRATVALNPRDVEAWNGLAIVLTRTCRAVEALVAADQALAVNPRSAAAHVTRSDILRDLHRYAEAEAGYERALWLKPNWPDAAYNRAFLQFALGRYRDGWRDYARRWDTTEFCLEQEIFQLKEGMRRRGPRWGGVPLAGRTLLVWAEQGHGDTLWGLRYVDRLLAGHPGASVVLQVQGPVFRHVWVNYRDRVQVVSRATDCPPWDVHVPLLNLPHVLGCWEPADAPAPRHRVEAGDALPRRPGPFRLGIVWGGSLSHANDPRRSTALGDWLPVLRVPGVEAVSLQIGPRADEGAPLFEAGLLTDPRAVIRDFADTANLLTTLDLVIGVDTGTLHLAAGMGVPTWWLIGEAPDWRYSYAGADPTRNVWYDRAQLWRKPYGAPWDGVFADVARALDRTLDDRRAA